MFVSEIYVELSSLKLRQRFSLRFLKKTSMIGVTFFLFYKDTLEFYLKSFFNLIFRYFKSVLILFSLVAVEKKIIPLL